MENFFEDPLWADIDQTLKTFQGHQGDGFTTLIREAQEAGLTLPYMSAMPKEGFLNMPEVLAFVYREVYGPRLIPMKVPSEQEGSRIQDQDNAPHQPASLIERRHAYLRNIWQGNPRQPNEELRQEAQLKTWLHSIEQLMPLDHIRWKCAVQELVISPHVDQKKRKPG